MTGGRDPMETPTPDTFGSLRGRGAVVVGGGGVLGLAIADGLRRAGSGVVIVDGECPARTRADQPGVGQPVFVKADVRDPDDVEAAFRQADHHLDQLAAVVNVPGAAGRQQPSQDLSEEEWQDILDRRLSGVFWSCQQAARRMLGAGGGSIVNVSSLAGVLIDRHDQRVHYHTANGAINTLTKGLAVEWGGCGVRVNAVAPGAILGVGDGGTLIDDEGRVVAAVPMQRLGRIEEIVSVALFLCSDASSYVTGQTLVADGGRGLLFD